MGRGGFAHALTSWPPLEQFRLNWLARAELSRHGDRLGLSFFFLHPLEFEAFAERLDPAIRADMADLESRYRLVPRRWLKLHYRHGEACGLSRYHVLDPRDAYPITTLRQLVRRYRQGDPARLEPGLLPALACPGVIWAAVLKHPASVLRLSCCIPRSLLPSLLASMVAAGLADADVAARYQAQELGGEEVYVTFQPGAPEALALDCKTSFGYRKVRPDGERVDYRPLADCLPPELLESLCRFDPQVEDVRRHFQERDRVILSEVGSTYQAARRDEDNLRLGDLAGLQPGLRVLDLGCGFGGPAIELAREWPGLTIHGLTLSPGQAEEASRLVAEAGLEERVTVACGDYHELPLADRSFDRVLFLESLNYAVDLPRVLREARRVLKPGGRLLIKDVFVRPGPLTPAERLEQAEFNRVWASRARPLDAVLTELEGWSDVRSEPLDAAWNLAAFHAAMGVTEGRAPTEFGRLHFRHYQQLPLAFHLVRATAP